MNESIDRRGFLRMAGVAGGTAVGAQFLNLLPEAFAHGESEESALPAIQGFPRKYEIKPLPFKPEKLKGLSAKLLLSHHENNYGGAVKNLMKVEAEIAKLPADAPPFAMTGLKASEHAFRNSMILHELYFENLGGNGKVQGKSEKLISAAWGSVSKFEHEFKTAGVGVGGGTGWVNLVWDLRTAQPVMSLTGHNNQFPPNAVPLLLMDVYEHAYAIDFGAKLKDYVEAFFANINWEVVDRRLESAQSISKLLRA
jgi:superoxide dismutase, Fe-Mn family